MAKLVHHVLFHQIDLFLIELWDISYLVGGASISLTYIASERIIPGYDSPYLLKHNLPYLLILKWLVVTEFNRYGGGMSSAKAALESDTKVSSLLLFFPNYLNFIPFSFKWEHRLRVVFSCWRSWPLKLEGKIKSESTQYLQVWPTRCSITCIVLVLIQMVLWNFTA